MNKLTFLACLMALMLSVAARGDDEQLLSNPNLDQGFSAENIPQGWSRYAGGKPMVRVDRVEGGVMLVDDDADAEIGITRQVPVEPSGRYRATATIRAVPDATSVGSYLQLRFVPSDKALYQVGLNFPAGRDTATIEVFGNSPRNATHAQLYLYTHRDVTPRVIIERVTLEKVGQAVTMDQSPRYGKLKPLYIDTSLVRDGKSNALIVVPEDRYRGDALRIQAAVRERTGVALDIVHDAPVPLENNVILLGNRSTNRVIEQLYNFHYTLLDLRYPGAGGHIVRSLHNPFGNGHNAIFVGGSDDAGVVAAAAQLAEHIATAPLDNQTLSLGHLADIALGDGVTLPASLNDMQIWDASLGYGSSGYFGWNSISKHAAMFYMTGDEEHARQFLRLAFPDDQAKRQISDIDGERIENKDDPLAGPYHYNAHMMILYWDLIEEAPFFTDEQRLAVTNAFSRQFEHRKDEGVWRMQSPPSYVGSRHGQWSAISLFCLARYFDHGYPSPFWAQCLHGSRMAFRSLHSHPWLYGEADNLYWYSTGIAPIFTYLALSGEREPIDNGVMDKLLKGQEILVAGYPGDPNIRYASLGFLHKAAYLMRDGRWLYYRDLTTMPTGDFRLGQSFWPEPHLQPQSPTDLVGKWTVNGLSRPEWASRNNGFALEESFHFASYRSAPGPDGDYMLLDGYNGESRNPYHSFALLELIQGGTKLLDGYLNQVLTRVDGMVEPTVAKNGALRYRGVIGETAIAVGEVPDAAYCNWRRTLVARSGRYLLTIDELTPRTNSDNLEAQVLWEPASAANAAVAGPGVVRLTGMNDQKLPAETIRLRAVESQISASIDDIVIYGFVILRARKVGEWLEMPFTLDEPMQGDVHIELLNYVDRGTVKIMLDGETVVESFNHHAARAEEAFVPLGRRELAAGEHRLRIETIGLSESGSSYIALTALNLVPDGATPANKNMTYDICLADPVPIVQTASAKAMRWTGPAREGETLTLFSLLAENPGGGEPYICNRISDTTAILAHRHGERAMAIAGSSDAADARFAVVGTDHLFALGVRRVSLSGLEMRASRPVDIDWDFTTGRAIVVADELAEIDLGDGYRRTIPGGGSVEITDVMPSASVRKQLAVHLNDLFNAASTSRHDAPVTGPEPLGELPPLTPRFVANVGAKVDDLIVIPGESPIFAAASGTKIELFDGQGTAIRAFNTDGPIRMLHWWPQHALLLAGCADEQVIAYNLEGERQWVFTSVMDPAVFRAAKTYWFKTAPGHEGIHGLSSGVFLNNESQCFVGSACTLEILNEKGELVRRMPQFWGKVSLFQIIDGPGDSLNLLTGRKWNGGHRLGIVNNKTLKDNQYGFTAVPPGVTYVGGWSSLNRHHLFYTDLDGDGVKEVVSEINGRWNRVTVWDIGGTALYDASFGPGERIPALNMMDIDVADIDADGKQEIVTATNSGLLVMLDHQCRKRWARALPTYVTVLAANEGVITAALQSGEILRFAPDGAPLGRGHLTGQPLHIERFGDELLIATEQGEIGCFAAQ
jgi:hypothetical protein